MRAMTDHAGGSNAQNSRPDGPEPRSEKGGCRKPGQTRIPDCAKQSQLPGRASGRHGPPCETTCETKPIAGARRAGEGPVVRNKAKPGKSGVSGEHLHRVGGESIMAPAVRNKANSTVKAFVEMPCGFAGGFETRPYERGASRETKPIWEAVDHTLSACQ
jgi:hypothetical protein